MGVYSVGQTPPPRPDLVTMLCAIGVSSSSACAGALGAWFGRGHASGGAA